MTSGRFGLLEHNVGRALVQKIRGPASLASYTPVNTFCNILQQTEVTIPFSGAV